MSPVATEPLAMRIAVGMISIVRAKGSKRRVLFALSSPKNKNSKSAMMIGRVNEISLTSIAEMAAVRDMQ